MCCTRCFFLLILRLTPKSTCTDTLFPYTTLFRSEIQEMVNRTPMKAQVRFVTVTTDPKNDTAEVLRDYGPAHGLDPVNWTFLTTMPDQPEDATRRLAEDYGHKFKKTEEGYQVHGIVTHVIDREGRWRANFHGDRKRVA